MEYKRCTNWTGIKGNSPAIKSLSFLEVYANSLVCLRLKINLLDRDLDKLCTTTSSPAEPQKYDHHLISLLSLAIYIYSILSTHHYWETFVWKPNHLSVYRALTVVTGTVYKYCICISTSQYYQLQDRVYMRWDVKQMK